MPVDQAANVSQERYDSAYTLMKTRVENTNERLGETLFANLRLQSDNAQLVLTVADLWYSLPEYLQDRTVDDWAKVWKAIASTHGWTGLARVQFVDMAGKQVAYKSWSIAR